MEKFFEINLLDIIFTVKRRLIIILIVTVFAGGACFFVSKFFITPKYESTATLMVKADQNENSQDTLYNNVALSQKLVASYTIILKNNTLLDNVIKKLNLQTNANSLAGSISVKGIGTTEIITISVLNSNPEKAKEIVGAIIELAPNEIARTIKTGSIAVISPPQTAIYVSPNKKTNTLLGMLIGFLFSSSVAIIYELFDNRFKTDDDITDKLHYTVIGIIPILKKKSMFNINSIDYKSEKLLSNMMVISEHMPFQFVESFNSLRTNLNFIAKDKNMKKIIVTSSIPEEGKTTVAVNLAISLGRLGKKVLVIDMDFRKSFFGENVYTSGFKNNGVSTVLTNDVTPYEAIEYIEKLGIFVMPTGPVTTNPSELLQSDSLNKLVAELEERFDNIIFDTAPVSVVADAITLLPVADGVIFVVKQNKTTFDSALNAKKILGNVNANVFGSILNAFDAKITNKTVLYNNNKYYKYNKKR